jgi:ubiquinone/menaquinone biosynthesis C-methylase UbiE
MPVAFARRSYTEEDVRDFFDETTQTYLSFWDADGVLHTGYFRTDDDDDYHLAADRTSLILASDAEIEGSSVVLDVGCGCGNFLTYLAWQFGCRCHGLDLSEERLKVAQAKVAEDSRLLDTPGIRFRCGSATQLPYESGAFSHVVSQDALFLVPDKPRSHAEIYRVLRPGGILAFSDFLQPRAVISQRARRHVYDRVRWSHGYSMTGYQAALEEAGFEMILARNLDRHIRQTYRVLGQAARERARTVDDPAAREWITAFAASCAEIQAAVDNAEFGWGMFVARKPASAPDE